MTTRFMGIAAPRSGTAWLSNFLTYGEHSFCFHEALYGCENMVQYLDAMDAPHTAATGSIETASGLVISGIADTLKANGYRMFVVYRDQNEVRASLKAAKLNDSTLKNVYAGLVWAIEELAVPVIPYERLYRLDTLEWLWRYIGIDAPFPLRRAELLRGLLVEDGRIKNFGRFVDEDAVQEGIDRFHALLASVYPNQFRQHQQSDGDWGRVIT